jgi:hypothetical protein
VSPGSPTGDPDSHTCDFLPVYQTACSDSARVRR